MADIKVLMMGGRRTGKSSILASMIYQLSKNTGLTQRYIRMIPTDENKTAEAQDAKLGKLISETEHQLTGSHYLVDFSADDSFNSYIYKDRIPKPNSSSTYARSIDIEFVDCPGEVFDNGADEAKVEALKMHIATSKVFMIVIDTPYLMDPESDHGEFNKVNKIERIKFFLQENNHFESEYDYKKVFFVPVKCEAWKDRLDEVVAKLSRDEYCGNLMELFNGDTRWSCSVLPVLTAGSLKFCEFTKPQMLKSTQEPCFRPGNTPFVRLGDGRQAMIPPGDLVIDNGTYLVHFKFYSWFTNTGEGFKPVNCDQIGLHLWRFIVFKVKTDKEQDGWLGNLFDGLPKIKQLKEMLDNMKKDNILKDEGMGIKHMHCPEKIM